MIDVVIPAYDAARTIGPIVQAFRAVPDIGQVTVVDDGSADGTQQIAYEAGALVVRGPGTGKGEAIAHGLAWVTTDRVVFCDPDIYGFAPEHAAAMMTDFEGILRGKITGLFRATNGPYPLMRMAPCLTAVRSMPSWLPKGIELTGLAYNEQLNMAASVCNLRTKFVNLDGLHPNMDKAYYDHGLFLLWAKAVIAGEVMIPRTHPASVVALKKWRGWLALHPADAGTS
jgi:glycosyltransferase involved in cell wall biosynthesis